MIRPANLNDVNGSQIVELYVDTFFENQGIGSKLLNYGIEQFGCNHLWGLEKNHNAIQFYERHGFSLTNEKIIEEGTTQFIIHMKLDKKNIQQVRQNPQYNI